MTFAPLPPGEQAPTPKAPEAGNLLWGRLGFETNVISREPWINIPHGYVHVVTYTGTKNQTQTYTEQ